MQNAAFSIIDYKFDHVYIDLHNHLNNSLNIKFDIKGVYHAEENVFELHFTNTLFNFEESHPYVVLSCRGNFKFEQVNSFEEIPDFFYRNCIAILFPYVRAYLSIVTTQANVPGVILPTMNLTGLEQELRNNTTQK